MTDNISSTEKKDQLIEAGMNSVQESSKSAPKSPTDLFESSDKSDDENDGLIQDPPDINVGYNEMEKPQNPPLRAVAMEPKYINVQNSREFVEANFTNKALMLYSYHTQLVKLLSHQSRQSFCPMPSPKPIQLQEIRDVSHVKNNNHEDEFEETYISRSGRQTKRKIYAEENLDEECVKKTKNSEDIRSVPDTLYTPSKRGNVSLAKKLPPKLADNNNELGDDHIEDIALNNNNDDSARLKVTPRKIKKAPYSIDISKTPSTSNKKISNEHDNEISSTFYESPKSRKPMHSPIHRFIRNSPQIRTRSCRSELLFDKLTEEKEKKEAEEKTMNDFLTTLDMYKETEMDTDMFEVPDNGNDGTDLSIGYEKSHQSNYTNTRRMRHTRAVSSINEFAESSDVECPICLVKFSQEIIMEHASTCGESQFITRHMVEPYRCHKCNKIVLNDTNHKC